MNLWKNTVRKKNYKVPKKIHKTTQVYLLAGMGHHALAGRAPLLEAGAMAQWKDGGEGEWMAWEEKGLKALTPVA